MRIDVPMFVLAMAVAAALMWTALQTRCEYFVDRTTMRWRPFGVGRGETLLPMWLAATAAAVVTYGGLARAQ